MLWVNFKPEFHSQMQVGDALLLISFKAAAEAQWQHSIFYLHWKGSTWVFIAIDVAPPPKLISLLKEKLKWEGELHEPEESKEEELHMIVIQSFSAILLSWLLTEYVFSEACNAAI